MSHSNAEIQTEEQENANVMEINVIKASKQKSNVGKENCGDSFNESHLEMEV
jgi:hypothetical protein